MPDNRRSNPNLQKSVPPFQTPFQQGFVFYQFSGYGQTVSAWPDQAETHYKRASALKDETRFVEALAAFDSAIALRPDYAQAHNGRGIVMAHLGRLAEAVSSFDSAIALKPDYAEAHNNRAIVLQDLGQLDDALDSLDRAIALQPDNAWAYNNRGAALHGLSRLAEALASHEKAIALKADYAEAYYNRGIVLQALDRLDDALTSFDRAIALKPGYAAAHNNRGTLLLDLMRLDDALAAFDKAIALTGGFAEAYVNKCHCLLLMGRFEEGWRLNEWRKKTEKPVGNRSFRQPLWLGKEDIANKTVFVHWEQGLGDTIQFFRYGKSLRARGASVVMSVQKPLHRLLSQSDTNVRFLTDDDVPEAFDYHCPLVSLPLALGTTLDNIPSEQPYLFADDALRKAWEARLPLATKLRVGVVWRGSAEHRNDRNRSIGLADFAPLFAIDAHWISLQKEMGEDDRALLRQFGQVSHYGEALSDFADTAAAIAGMNLVITVDTSVGHLAGAMGKEVWLLLPFTPDWRWQCGRDDSPWYPTARLFRQQAPRAWATVIARVQAALAQRL